MIKNSVLEQRRATKRLFIKRLKRGNSIEKLQSKLTELAAEFPYNSEYYEALEKGLHKLKECIKC